MENNRREQEDAIGKVYEASRTGCVEALNQVMQKDPLILRRLLVTNKTETPLHVSALLGHLDFTKTLHAHHPELVKEEDSFRRLPLHLASAGGHKETVRVLLSSYADACLLRDQDGRIPLHYAAMRGRVEVLKELMRAKPESIFVLVLNRSETVFHLCVQYNKLECLRVLVEEVGEDSTFRNSRGSDGGMTILHLAVMLRQVETITYLLSLPVIRGKTNSVNEMAVNMLDVLICSSTSATPREDFRKSMEIQQILMDAGIRRSEKNENIEQSLLPAPDLQTPVNKGISKARWCGKLITKCLQYKNEKWLEETRGALMLVSTMISTMTFQAAINPPAPKPVSQQSATLDDTQELFESLFLRFNTLSFLSSLTVTLLLVSGFPLNHRFPMWLLSMALCVTLLFTAQTYLFSATLVTPSESFYNPEEDFGPIWGMVWFGLLLLIFGFHFLRFLVWLVRKLRRKYFRDLKSIVSLRNRDAARMAPTGSGGHV